MNRRNFIKQFLTFSPMIAVPSVAIATMAHTKSDNVEKKFDKFVLHGDHVQINNCQFTFPGSIEIHGEQASIINCNITMNTTAPESYAFKKFNPS